MTCDGSNRRLGENVEKTDSREARPDEAIQFAPFLVRLQFPGISGDALGDAPETQPNHDQPGQETWQPVPRGCVCEGHFLHNFRGTVRRQQFRGEAGEPSHLAQFAQIPLNTFSDTFISLTNTFRLTFDLIGAYVNHVR
jgi:hypothetical protein